MSVPTDRSPPWEEGGTSTRIRSSSSTPPSDTAAERLTDDLLVEILSRVPAKSLGRFKCVSNQWLNLIDHPDHHKKLPQTLAGFFHSSTATFQWRMEVPIHFTGVPGRCCPRIDTSCSFLANHRRVDLLDCCNGLLLCRWYDISTHGDEFRYVVCNPATEKWVILPDSGRATNELCGVRLGFDLALSSHFHVFELFEEHEDPWDPNLAGVAVYSSETGGWVYKEITWKENVRLTNRHLATTIFLHGYLHFLVDGRELEHRLAFVDTKGETWMNFGVPDGCADGFIQRSQSCLHYSNFQSNEEGVGSRLAVYVLDGYDSKEWILKHSVDTSYVFQGRHVCFDEDFQWIAIHPECNLILFTIRSDGGMAFMCYNMDRREVKVISNLEDVKLPYLPYVPLYAELQSLHI